MNAVRLPVGGALAASIRFLSIGWGQAWGALGLSSLCVWALLDGRAGSRLAWGLAALLAVLVARGALWRLALRGGEPGPAGLQLGRVEARLASVWALAALFMAILLLLAFVVLLCAAYAAASAGPGFDPGQVASWTSAIDARGRVLLGVVAFAVAAALAVAWARIGLAEPASLARGHVQVLSTWAMTRGQTTKLLLVRALVAVPVLVAFAGSSALGGAAGATEALALGALWLPMSVGLMAYSWERIAAGTA